mmetsp:Transcript_29380/g.57331  ORF Transcript_29380/g.57331 Transcript_29380/m.57331 type:complete len:217 (+) Transcript_29380:924-1574(+)
MHDLWPKLIAQPADFDDGVTFWRVSHIHTPNCAKKIENNASSAITRKMPCTTLEVVRCPTLVELPFTWKACQQATTPITSAKNGAFTMPTRRCFTAMLSCRRVRNMPGFTSRLTQLISAPPNRPNRLATKPKSGNMINSASTRGTTSTRTGSRPSVCIASISCCTFIEPTEAVKADPERPATMIAVSKMPNSRSTEMPISSTTKTSAPNCCNWLAP